MSRLALAGEIHQRRGARHQRSGEEHHGVEARPVAPHLDGRHAGGAAGGCGSAPDLRIDALGSGSDYTAFIDHLGIASLNLGFGGEDGGGIYHSIYDDFYWYTHFADGDFVYGRALAQTIGSAVLRLADADVLPYDFTQSRRHGATATSTSCRSCGRARATASRSAIARSKKACSAPPAIRGVPLLPPPAEAVPPFLNFAPLENGAAALTEERRPLREGAGESHAGGPEPGVVEREADPDGAWADGSRRVCRGAPGSGTSSTRRASTPATA